ncbi:MAG: hypothetical protein DWH78_12040 [Planctomycetota bacterium]|nr:MAG: hypothetical protein DWH78_12040 [Planctomycetota bacterium]
MEMNSADEPSDRRLVAQPTGFLMCSRVLQCLLSSVFTSKPITGRFQDVQSNMVMMMPNVVGVESLNSVLAPNLHDL